MDYCAPQNAEQIHIKSLAQSPCAFMQKSYISFLTRNNIFSNMALPWSHLRFELPQVFHTIIFVI